MKEEYTHEEVAQSEMVTNELWQQVMEDYERRGDAAFEECAKAILGLTASGQFCAAALLSAAGAKASVVLMWKKVKEEV